MSKYGIWSIEAWANACEEDGCESDDCHHGGWTWNDKHRVAIVEVAEAPPSPEVVVQLLKERGAINVRAVYRTDTYLAYNNPTLTDVAVEDPNGMGEIIEVQSAYDREPLFEVR